MGHNYHKKTSLIDYQKEFSIHSNQNVISISFVQFVVLGTKTFKFLIRTLKLHKNVMKINLIKWYNIYELY